jgi:hypothetical protein
MTAHYALTWQGQTVDLRRKALGYAVQVDTHWVYSFDACGRLNWVSEAGEGYQRGLNNQVLYKSRAQGQRLRRLLTEPERAAFYQRVFDLLTGLRAVAPPPAAEVLAPLLRWPPAALDVDGERFATIYRPVSILPPDQYGAIVLQAAEGCSYNRCTFCDFYKDRRFRIKSEAEFADHLADVQQFLGAAAAQRRTLFLADGDALMIPQARLRKLVQAMSQAFPGRSWYSFMDAFRPGAKTLEDYQELKALGLQRVYIGLETGHAPLLEFIQKPGTPQQMAEEMVRMKQAGLNLGIIVMVGVGGEAYAQAHTQETVALLRALPLGAGDIVYFSEFIPHPDQPYAAKAAAAGIQPLDALAIAAQYQAMRAALPFAPKAPQLSLYHLQEYIY